MRHPARPEFRDDGLIGIRPDEQRPLRHHCLQRRGIAGPALALLGFTLKELDQQIGVLLVPVATSFDAGAGFEGLA